MKKMSTAKTKSVKGGATLTKKATGASADKKEKEIKALLMEAISMLGEGKKANLSNPKAVRTKTRKG